MCLDDLRQVNSFPSSHWKKKIKKQNNKNKSLTFASQSHSCSLPTGNEEKYRLF